jgi:hypothetical protein
MNCSLDESYTFCFSSYLSLLVTFALTDDAVISPWHSNDGTNDDLITSPSLLGHREKNGVGGDRCELKLCY